MAEHRTTLRWQRMGAAFERGNLPRDHVVTFDGGQMLHVSAAADYGGNAAHADPEQLLVAALSSCHMLTFLAVVANRGFVVDDYADDAAGTLGKNADGASAVTDVVLRPRVRFGGERVPSPEDVTRFHERAHKACFIANSVRASVRVEPQPG
jgi:organic hydroperoxide reductase OsmC/OhrA